MAESRVKDKNYITIQGFMLTDLKLKGNELIVYACIYGFSQAENQVFNGSLQYLAEWTNSSKQSVMKCLKSLEEKGFIVKKENYINGVKFCEYYTTKLDTLYNKVEYPMQQSLGGIQQSLMGGMQQSLMGGIQQSLPNNIELNNISSDNIDNKLEEIILHKEEKKNNTKEKEIEQEFEILWSMYPRKKGKANALKAYKKARKENVPFEAIKQGVENYSRDCQRNKTEEQYIKHGSSWFNQQCWQDEYSATNQPQTKQQRVNQAFANVFAELEKGEY